MNPRRPRYLVLRIVLIWSGGFPFFYGLSGMIASENIATITGIISRGVVVLTPETGYLLKPLALYIMMFGAMLMFAAVDPERYRPVITWGAMLFFLRGLQRGLVTDDLTQLFHIPKLLNYAHVGYLCLLGASLWLLRPKPVPWNGPVPPPAAYTPIERPPASSDAPPARPPHEVDEAVGSKG